MSPLTVLADSRSTWRFDSCTSPLTLPASSARTLSAVAITVPLTVPSVSVVGALMSRARHVARDRLGHDEVRRRADLHVAAHRFGAHFAAHAGRPRRRRRWSSPRRRRCQRHGDRVVDARRQCRGRSTCADRSCALRRGCRPASTSMRSCAEQPLALLGIAMAHALDRLDPDLVAAAGRHADVAGDVLQIERAVGADLVRFGEALGLLRALPRLLVALEPGDARVSRRAPARAVTAAAAGVGAAPARRPTERRDVRYRIMASLIESLNEAPGFGLVAFAHLVDQFDGLLQQRDLRAHRVEQAVLRVGAGRLLLAARRGSRRSPDRSPAGSSAAPRRPADRARRCRLRAICSSP